MLWIAVVLLLLITLLLIAQPLLKSGGEERDRRADYDLAVFKDQLAELEEEQRQGAIEASSAQAAKLEIERRMLAADAQGAAQARPLALARRKLLAAFLATVFSLGGVGIYLLLGSPGMQNQPYIDRLARRLGLPAEAAQAQLDEAARLVEKLSANPGDAGAWRDLGRVQRLLGRHGDGAESLKQALAQGERDPEVIAEMAESQVYEAQGEVGEAAKRAFETVLLVLPDHPKALYFLGQERLQANDAQGALKLWRRLESLSQADAPWLPMLRQRIAEAEGKTNGTAHQNAQGAPDIAAMIVKLEERLRADPKNVQGWTMLGRSYAALGDMEKAKSAYGKALQLVPDDLELKQAYAVMLFEATRRADAKAKVPVEAARLMDEVLKADPTAMDALFVAGQAALDGGDKAKAKALWSRLLQQLDPNDRDAADLKKMIEGL